MIKKILMLICICLLISNLCPVIAQSTNSIRSEKISTQSDETKQITDQQDEKTKKIKTLVEKAKKDGKVRILVELNTPFAPEGNLTSSQAQLQHDKIKNFQVSIINSISRQDRDLIYNFKHAPFMTLNANENTLKNLETNSMVKTIYEDKLSRPLLTSSIPLIGASNTHSLGYTGSGQTIAILDTGFDLTHPALVGKIVSESCYSTTFAPLFSTTVCPNGLSTQTTSGSAASLSNTISGFDHGTHVAGIAAGNGGGVVGVASDATIIAVQVFSKITDVSSCSPEPSPCMRSYLSDQILGLERVFELRNSFDIAAVNLSLGSDAFTSVCDSDPQKTVIDQLKSVGIATVVASGNDGFINALSSPACISSAISVGSSTVDSHGSGLNDDEISSFSNTASFLDLLSPGQFILSSVPDGTTSLQAGTSMAAPHVTGAFAVLKEKSSNASVDDILSDLKNTGIPILDSGNGLTFPRIYLSAALADISIPVGSDVPGCENTNTCYIPFNHVISQGQQVIWHNSDSAAHTVTSGTPSEGPDGIFDSSLILAGELFSHTFENSGTFDYFDLVHPWQNGQITVNVSACITPISGTWTITSSCTLTSSAIAPGNVIVDNNSILTIPSGITLDIDFATKNLTVKSGSGVLIKSGGSIN